MCVDAERERQRESKGGEGMGKDIKWNKITKEAPKSHALILHAHLHQSLKQYPLDQCINLFIFYEGKEKKNFIASSFIPEWGEKQKPATEICMVLNYTLVNITWQSVHINLIGF